MVGKISTKDVIYPIEIIDNIQLINLFENIFKKNPLDRITIDQIRKHVWMLNLPTNLIRNKFNLKLNSHEEEFNVLLKPRTKYDDIYRSMSMTPYIHQMYYPIHDNLNIIQLNENEIDEFENLKKIPIVRSNRNKEFINQHDQINDNLELRILKVVGSNLETIYNRNNKLKAKIK